MHSNAAALVRRLLPSDRDGLQRWRHVPDRLSSTPIAVALSNPSWRIEVASALVCAGLRIVLVRNAVQLAKLLPAVEIVVADPHFIGDQSVSAEPALAMVAVLEVTDGSNPGSAAEVAPRSGVTVVFRLPDELDELVTAAVFATY